MNVIAMREAADLKEKELIGLLLKAESAKTMLTVAEKQFRMSLGGSFAAASALEVKVNEAKEKVAKAEKIYDDAHTEYMSMWNAYLVALAAHQAAEAETKAKASAQAVAEAKVADYKKVLEEMRAELAAAKDLKTIAVLLNEFEYAEKTFRGAAAALCVEW